MTRYCLLCASPVDSDSPCIRCQAGRAVKPVVPVLATVDWFLDCLLIGMAVVVTDLCIYAELVGR